MTPCTRREFLSTAAACVVTTLGLSDAIAQDDATRKRPPNVVFILADDLGWAELGCYGNAFNETPHLDDLAKRGMRFTQAYAAAPVCSPTRAALMTGQYPPRVGITDYLSANDTNFLDPARTTLNEALGGAGYKTGLIGKWHLTGNYDTKRGEPAKHGWDEVICSETSYIAGGKYFHPYFFMKGLEARSKHEYLTDRLSLEATDFIARHRREPFMLYLSHYSVHTRLAAKRDKIERYKRKLGAGKRKNNPVLAAMIESIDESVGRIISKLRELGIERDTVVVFTSDNGGEDRVTSNARLRGGKSQLYEGGIRVPMIVCWPAGVRGNSVCDVPVNTIDFYPTLLDLAGIRERPSKHVLDGESLMPLLRQTGGLEREDLYWHYPRTKPHFLGGRSSGAIRKGDYKLIEFFDTGVRELYNLADDPGEQRNLMQRMPGKVIELKRDLEAWRKRVGATVPKREEH